MWRAICYQYMARRAANEFSYHLIVQTGGLAGELNSLVIVERAICGWKRVKAENPERTHTPPILFVTTRKTEAWKICSVENPCFPLSPKSPFSLWIIENRKLNETKGLFDGDKSANENQKIQFEKLSVWPFVGQIERLVNYSLALFSSSLLVSVAKSKWEKKTTVGFGIAFCIGTRNAYKSYKFGDTNTISELWIVADTVSICRPCVRGFFRTS